MTEKDRGTYSPPTEDSLNYESRRPAARDQAPITLIISGIFLVVLLLAVVLFYNSGLNNHGRLPPDVGDSIGDIKDAKVEDAKPLSDQDLTGDDSGQAKFAPVTEAPLRDQSASQGPVTEAPPPAKPIQGPLPSQADNPAITGDKPATTPAPAQAAPAQTPPAASPQAALTPAKPAAKPAAIKPVTPPVVTPAPVQAKATTPETPAIRGAALVQIGAFESMEIANKEYSSVASNYGLFLSGTSKRIEKVETPKGTFYRTSFAGFASADKAKAFCSALKASHHDCFVK